MRALALLGSRLPSGLFACRAGRIFSQGTVEAIKLYFDLPEKATFLFCRGSLGRFRKGCCKVPDLFLLK